jgi:hypothetical protein
LEQGEWVEQGLTCGEGKDCNTSSGAENLKLHNRKMFVSQASASILLLLLLLFSVVTGQPIVDLMNEWNTHLETDGSDVLIESASFFVSQDASVDQAGKISFFNNCGSELCCLLVGIQTILSVTSNKNPSVLSTFAIDQVDLTQDVANNVAQMGAIRNPFATCWTDQNCAKKELNLQEVSVTASDDIGLVQAILRQGGRD